MGLQGSSGRQGEASGQRRASLSVCLSWRASATDPRRLADTVNYIGRPVPVADLLDEIYRGATEDCCMQAAIMQPCTNIF